MWLLMCSFNSKEVMRIQISNEYLHRPLKVTEPTIAEPDKWTLMTLLIQETNTAAMS